MQITRLFILCTFLFLIKGINVSFSQKTLEFRILRVNSFIGDMDAGILPGLNSGDSDPHWDFSIEDVTNSITQSGTYSLTETNCPGTRIINQTFFSQAYCYELPSNYLFTWSAEELDAPGGEAQTGNEVIPFTNLDINQNQSSWTALANRTRFVNGTTCSGGQVAWGIYLEYRVTGTFSTVAANFSATPKNGCSVPHTVFFTDQSTLPDTWSWDFGDGNTSTLQNPVHNYTSTGTYVVRLAIADTITGCLDTAYDTVKISIPNADFTASPVFGCGPLAVNFTDLSSGTTPIVGWNWNFGDGNTSNQQNPIHTYQNPGLYDVTLFATDSNGCTVSKTETNYIQVIGPDVNFGFDDSLACLNQTINFSDSTIFTAPITSWAWDFGDGNTSPLQNPSHAYSSNGKFTVSLTVTDIDGCTRTKTDSLLVVNSIADFSASTTSGCFPLTVNFTDASSADTTITNWSWDFGDGNTSTLQNPSNIYAQPGSYTVILTITDAAGCSKSESDVITVNGSIARIDKNDSIVCENDTIFFADSSIANGTILSWNWDFGDGGASSMQHPFHVYNTPGLFYVTLTIMDINGCSQSIMDSILVQQPVSFFKLDNQIGCDSLTVIFTDSSYFTDLSPHPTNTVSNWNWDFGDGNTTSLQNPTHTYVTAGTFQISLEISNSNTPTCFDTSYSSVTVYRSNDTLLFDTICENEIYVTSLGDTLPSVTNSYYDTVNNVNGCDSVIQIDLFVLPVSQDTIYDTICENDSIQLISGNYVNTQGIYNDTLTKLNGCDSIITTILQVNDTIHITIYDTICENDSIQLPSGNYINTNGTYIDTLLRISTGCDSIITTHLHILDTIHTHLHDTICENDSIQLSNGDYTNLTGTYHDTLSTITGCDSIIFLHLFVNDTIHNTHFDTICENEYYITSKGDTLPQANGIYNDTSSSVNGCDSITYINLFILPISIDTVYDTICRNDSIQLPNGTYTNSSGTYTDTLSRINTGCDSIITTILLVNDTSHTNLYDTICPNDSVRLSNGSFVNTAGIYRDTLSKLNTGCDSIIIFNLTVNDTSQTVIYDSICENDSLLLPNGNYTNTAGTYIDTLQKLTTGCDSIVTIYLHVNDTIHVVIYDTICENETYVFPSGNNTANTAGTYNDTLPRIGTGCDSIMVIQLHVNDTSNITVFDTICASQTYTLPGGAMVNSSGVYTDTLPNLTGCDSIITTNLHVISPVFSNIDTGFCEGDSVLINGRYIASSGTYNDTLISAAGCDSIIQINVTEYQPFTENLTLNICNNDSVFLQGQWRKTAGTYVDSLLSVNGCDSIVTTKLFVNNSSQHKVFDTICQGEIIFIGGSHQSTAGNYFDTLTNSAGCDSILETELFVAPMPTFIHSNDTSITIGDQVPLFVSGSYDYSWTPGVGLSCTNCPNPTATPLTTITYQVKVSLGGCDSTVSITINVQEEAEIFVPTIFSPNGDNWNDIFRIRGSVFTNYRMTIFNRWGEKVFETDNYTEGWDGTFRGKDCNKGAYAYIIEGLDHRNRVFKKKGNITLIR